MTVAGIATVPVVPDFKGFGTALTAGIREPLSQLGNQVKSALSGLSAGGAVAVGAGAAIAFGLDKAIKTTVELGDETRKLQRELGLSAEDASRLRVAGEELGIGTDKLSRAFGLFSKNVENATPALKSYGIQIVRNKDGNLNFLATLENVADKYKELGGGARGAALAMNVFGRSGKDIIPILQQGSEGIADLLKEADKFGLVFNAKNLNDIRQLGIAQEQLGEAAQGLEVALAKNLIPALTEATKAFTDMVNKARPVADLIGHVLPPAFSLLGSYIDRFLHPLHSLLHPVSTIKDSFLDLWHSLGLGKKSTEDIQKQNEDLAQSMQDADFATMSQKDATDALNKSMQLAFPPTASYRAEVGALVFVQQAEASAAAAAAPHIMTLAEQHKELAQAARDAYAAELALENQFLGVEGAAINLRNAQADLAEAHKKVRDLTNQGKKGTAEYAQAMEDLRQAELNAVLAQGDLEGKVNDYLKSLQGGETTQAQAIAHIKDMGVKAGLSNSEIAGLISRVQGYIGALRKIPPTVTTKVLLQGLSAASAAFHAWLNDLRVQGAAGVTVAARLFRTDAGIIPHRASGGWVMAGQPYTVGERGTETFVPAQPGYVVPHGQGGDWSSMAAAIDRMARRPIVIQIDRREIARAVANDSVWGS